jgi:hypothetical protein
VATPVETYEQQLANNPRLAMAEMGAFFEGESKVHRALTNIARKLDELGIPYAVAGGMALFQHGYRRTTDDVDILVTREGLKKIHEELEGLGYVPPFKNSKHLRDVREGVRIEFLTTGDFPGDGKPKSIAFPDPAEAGVERDGIRYLNLLPLIQLKLASGMSAAHRAKDLVDVQELTKALRLPVELADQMDPSVAGEYRRLWAQANASRRFITLWRNKWLTAEATSIDDMAAKLRAAADLLDEMRRDGVTLDPEAGGVGDDYAHLITHDQAIAEKYDMHPEEDWLDDEEAGDVRD